MGEKCFELTPFNAVCLSPETNINLFLVLYVVHKISLFFVFVIREDVLHCGMYSYK